MGSITFVAVAKSLIPLNVSSSIMALQLNHSLQQHTSFPITVFLTPCGTPGSTARLLLTLCPFQGLWWGPSIFDFQPVWRGPGRRSGMQCRADALGHLPLEGAGRGLSSVGATWKGPGEFTGSSYHASSSGVTSYISPASTLRGSPKQILLTKMEG